MSLFGLLLAQPGRLHLIEFTENDIKLRGIRSSKRQLKHIIYLMNFQIGFLKNMDQFVSASQCSPHRNRYSMHSNNCFFCHFHFDSIRDAYLMLSAHKTEIKTINARNVNVFFEISLTMYKWQCWWWRSLRSRFYLLCKCKSVFSIWIKQIDKALTLKCLIKR